MSENQNLSLSYSLGIIHGNLNVLTRILKSINQREPITSGKLIVHFAELIGSLNETDLIRENGKFAVNDRGEIFFDWIPEVRERIVNNLTIDI